MITCYILQKAWIAFPRTILQWSYYVSKIEANHGKGKQKLAGN